MLKASELINRLQKIIDEKGDLPVLIHNKGFGGYEVMTIDSVVETSIGSSDFEDEIDPETWDKLFPGEAFTEDTDVETETIELYTGRSLYTT